MLKIGITGGIGSGKSMVSRIIETFGFTVFNSDFEAKNIMNTNQVVREELITILGPSAYNSAGLYREFLAKKIFSDASLRQKINKIVHPRVREAFEQICNSEKKDVIFNEAAILIETGSYKDFDLIVLVTAPEELRIERVMKRDAINFKEVKSRIDNQWTDVRKIEFADFVILNDENSPLLTQIEDLINQVTSS